MDAALIAVKSDGSQNEIAVSGETMTIGRDHGCTVRVAVASVSRRHCEIDAEDGEIVIRDLGSSNGTYVNGDRVQEASLSPGDLIGVGPVVFVVRVGDDPSSIDPVEVFRAGNASAAKKKKARSEAPASDDPFAAAAAVDETPTTMPDDSSFADFDFNFMDEEDDLPKL